MKSIKTKSHSPEKSNLKGYLYCYKLKKTTKLRQIHRSEVTNMYSNSIFNISLNTHNQHLNGTCRGVASIQYVLLHSQ